MNKLEYIPGDLGTYNGNIVTIENSDGYYATYYDEDEFLQEINVNVIEGIPLTPNILSKNSFKIIRQDESGALYSKEGLGIDIVASYVRNCYDIYIDGNKILKGIKYCHQLQHFLFGLGLNHEMEV